MQHNQRNSHLPSFPMPAARSMDPGAQHRRWKPMTAVATPGKFQCRRLKVGAKLPHSYTSYAVYKKYKSNHVYIAGNKQRKCLLQTMYLANLLKTGGLFTASGEISHCNMRQLQCPKYCLKEPDLHKPRQWGVHFSECEAWSGSSFSIHGEIMRYRFGGWLDWSFTSLAP